MDFSKFAYTPDGWWPEKGLERACLEYETSQIALAKEAQKTIIQPTHAERLDEEGVYALVSYVLKKAPIIEYQSNQDWFNARDIWLVRDGRQYNTFVVLRK